MNQSLLTEMSALLCSEDLLFSELSVYPFNLLVIPNRCAVDLISSTLLFVQIGFEQILLW